jgi:hypothetical protein
MRTIGLIAYPAGSRIGAPLGAIARGVPLPSRRKGEISGNFGLLVSYRRYRSRTPCTVMTQTARYGLQDRASI